MHAGASPATPSRLLGEMEKDKEIPLSHYQSPTGAGPSGWAADGSPSADLRSTVSSEALEYSESARLVNAALSDDGMTPLIQPPRTRKGKLLLFCKRLLNFFLSHWSKALIIGIIITLIVLVSIKGFGFFGDLLAWFQRHNGWAGWGIFVGMYTAMVALFLPGVVLILGAGFVFGFWRGLLAVWAGGAVGQALAFLLARYLFHSWVENTLRTKWKKWAIIDKAIEHDGWKLVLILRFSPIIPYNLLNIAMASTNIPFWQFTIVSAVGIVYECAVFAYFGSMADSIHSIISGEGGRPPWFEWVMLGVSAVMCVVGAFFVSYSIKQAVRRAERSMSSARLEGLADGGEQDPELGVLMDGTYPESLEREGFVGSSTSYNLPSSPEFELKAVGSGGNAAAPGGAARDKGKARLLNASGSSALLAVTAASGGSGSLQTLLGPGGQPTPRKQKLSPKASSASLDGARRFSSTDGGGTEDGEVARDPSNKATRRHPSIGGESML